MWSGGRKCSTDEMRAREAANALAFMSLQDYQMPTRWKNNKARCLLLRQMMEKMKNRYMRIGVRATQKSCYRPFKNHKSDWVENRLDAFKPITRSKTRNKTGKLSKVDLKKSLDKIIHPTGPSAKKLDLEQERLVLCSRGDGCTKGGERWDFSCRMRRIGIVRRRVAW